MRKSALRILALIVTTTMLAGAAGFTSVSARVSSKTSKSAHLKKHPGRISRALPIAGPAGDVCPGIGRSFECKIWPPPLYDDPDRKNSGTDGG
jgi:hypothetical protein